MTNPVGASTDVRADWAAPQIVCGGSMLPTRVEQRLFSFEGGVDEFTLANVEAGGALAASAAFATHGAGGLEVTSPVDGNWFGRRFAAPFDRTQVQGIWVFLKDGTFQIDNIRVE